MMKRVLVIFTITVSLLSMNAHATDVTGYVPDLGSAIGTTAAVIDEDFQEAIGVADTVPVKVIDSVSGQTNEGPIKGGAGDFYMLKERNKFREYHGPDFHFLKNITNPSVKPYTFMQDQTWVGIPVFASGWIIKGEKEAFRQNYKNPNTKIRLVKYDFHSEIDNYTQFAGIALTAGLKMGGARHGPAWPLRQWPPMP